MLHAHTHVAVELSVLAITDLTIGFFQIQTPTVLNIFVSFIFIFSYF